MAKMFEYQYQVTKAGSKPIAGNWCDDRPVLYLGEVMWMRRRVVKDYDDPVLIARC